MTSLRKIQRDLAAARLAGELPQESARDRKTRISLTLAHWRPFGAVFVHVPGALNRPGGPAGLVAMYANATFSVQVFDTYQAQGVDWLMVRRHDEAPDFSWYDLQTVKNQISGPERLAVEVFPPESELVDEANIRHLWVYPAGHRLGFGL